LGIVPVGIHVLVQHFISQNSTNFSVFFFIFGQVASQLAFNQSEWQMKYLGETPAAERFQNFKIYSNDKNSTEN
jgi:hypothetical protein